MPNGGRPVSNQNIFVTFVQKLSSNPTGRPCLWRVAWPQTQDRKRYHTIAVNISSRVKAGLSRSLAEGRLHDCNIGTVHNTISVEVASPRNSEKITID
jgi:hypothetical protein